MFGAILFGLLNSLFMGAGNSMSRIPTKAWGENRFLVIRTIITSSGLLLLLLPNVKVSHFEIRQIVLAFVLSIISYFAMFFLSQSFKVGKLGVVSPITASSLLISTLLTIVFFHSKISTLQSGAMLIIFIAIFLGNANFSDFKNSSVVNRESGIPQAILSCILFGIFFFLAQIPTKTLGSFLAAFCFEIGILICAIVASILDGKTKKRKSSKKVSVFAFISAILSVFGIITFYYGLEKFNPAIVLILSATTPIAATAIGLLVYKEKLGLKQWLANVVILAGIIVLAL